MIRPYSIHPSSHVWSRLGKIGFMLACISLGWMLCADYNRALDDYVCGFGRGEVTQLFNGNDWRN